MSPIPNTTLGFAGPSGFNHEVKIDESNLPALKDFGCPEIEDAPENAPEDTMDNTHEDLLSSDALITEAEAELEETKIGVGSGLDDYDGKDEGEISTKEVVPYDNFRAYGNVVIDSEIVLKRICGDLHSACEFVIETGPVLNQYPVHSNGDDLRNPLHDGNESSSGAVLIIGSGHAYTDGDGDGDGDGLNVDIDVKDPHLEVIAETLKLIGVVLSQDGNDETPKAASQPISTDAINNEKRPLRVGRIRIGGNKKARVDSKKLRKEEREQIAKAYSEYVVGGVSLGIQINFGQKGKYQADYKNTIDERGSDSKVTNLGTGIRKKDRASILSALSFGGYRFPTYAGPSGFFGSGLPVYNRQPCPKKKGAPEPTKEPTKQLPQAQVEMGAGEFETIPWQGSFKIIVPGANSVDHSWDAIDPDESIIEESRFYASVVGQICSYAKISADDARFFLTAAQQSLEAIHGGKFSQEKTVEIVRERMANGSLIVGAQSVGSIRGITAMWAGREIDWHYE